MPDYTQNLVVDGIEKYQSTSLDGLVITNSGNYAAIDYANKKYIVNDKEILIKGDDGGVFINDDASHILYYDSGWILDGKPVKIQKIGPQTAEIIDNTIFIYNLMN